MVEPARESTSAVPVADVLGESAEDDLDLAAAQARVAVHVVDRRRC